MASVSLRLPGVDLSKTLTLDSTSFLSGNLHDEARPRFSLNTTVDGNGPSTTINSFSSFDPVEATGRLPTSEVGVVEWRLSSVGRPKTIVKSVSHNKTLTLGSLMKSNSFGSKRYFGGLGGDEVRWQETDGTWQCTYGTADRDREPKILAVLHSRIATRGTRIEVSTLGAGQMDTIVLTALLVLHGEGDWKQFANRPVPSPYSFYQPRLVVAPVPHVTALKLTLSTNSFIDGILAVEGQLMYSMRTQGNRTSISKYTWEERPRLEEFASIEWHSSMIFGKQRSIVTYKGQTNPLNEIIFSAVLGNRMRRFGKSDFLPWLQWIENPPAWTCVSHPGRNPLAILDRRFMTAGTTLDVTMEGLEFLDALVLTTILVVHSPEDWRRLENLRRNQPRPQRPINPRIQSENLIQTVNIAQRDEDGPPGLPRRHSDSRISRVSGDSDIPAYSPPPRGLMVNYSASYMDPRPSPLQSAAASRINVTAAVIVGGISTASLATARQNAPSGRIETVEDLPPSYNPPGYESS